MKMRQRKLHLYGSTLRLHCGDAPDCLGKEGAYEQGTIAREDVQDNGIVDRSCRHNVIPEVIWCPHICYSLLSISYLNIGRVNCIRELMPILRTASDTYG